MHNTVDTTHHKFTQLVIFLAWFLPIIASASYERIDADVINYTIVLSIATGLFFLFVVLRINNVSKNTYYVLLFIYGFAWLSDLNEYTEIIVFSSYALLAHLIGYNFPKLLYKQYLMVCYLIGIMAIVDLVSFNTMGATMIGRSDINPFNEYFPRISTFFDEPSGQAMFLGPALFYLLSGIISVSKTRTKDNWSLTILILVAYLLPFSLTAYFMLFVFFLYFLIIHRSSYKTILFALILIFAAVSSADISNMIIDKSNTAISRDIYYDNYGVSTSGAGLIALRDILSNTGVFDILVGLGYYNTFTVLPQYLAGSELELYYRSVGFFDNFASVGLVHLLYGYGLPGISVIIYFLWRSFKNLPDKPLALATIFVVILSMVKSPQSIGESMFIFFVFGLYWSAGPTRTAYMPVKTQLISKYTYTHG